MRILGYLDHTACKTTVFQSDNRLLVKFETGMYEQTYKIRMGGDINTLEDVKRWIDEPFLEIVMMRFNQMHHDASKAFLRFRNSETSTGTGFEKIV